MAFAKWSDINKSAKATLKPDFGTKNWGEVTAQDKQNIYQFFCNKGWFVGIDNDFYNAVVQFSDDHKARAFCKNLIAHGGPHRYDRGYGRQKCCDEAAVYDFYHLFNNEHQDVVYELISYYAESLSHSPDNEKLGRFIRIFNDLAEQFGLNVILSKSGLMFKQEEKITKNIYEPTLKYLSAGKWNVVNRELGDAFADYLKNTPDGYSACITHTVSGVQAFLQILVNGSVGKGDIAELINTGLKNGVIPNDPFSTKIFKDLNSVLMQERQAKSDSHPKKEYANEKSSRLLLNLAMVFMQHCLQP